MFLSNFQNLKFPAKKIDRTAIVWIISTGKPAQVLRGHKSYIMALQFLDHRRIVTGSWDTTIRVRKFSRQKSFH